MRASEIAVLVGGSLEGEGDPELTGVAPLDRAGPQQLSFLAHPRYLPHVPRARAGALLVSPTLAARAAPKGPRIVVSDVHRALAALLPRLYPEPTAEPGVHPTAVLAAGVAMGAAATIGPYAVIGTGARMGDRVRIGAHTVVGAQCTLADDVVLYPHVTLYPRVRIGPRSILHSGVRVGVDGFGYVQIDGAHHKIPQVGECVIGADVEIGANTTIDRGSIGATEIGDGVKIDNLVHIGHNVRVGEHSVIVAQVGIAGSTTVGRRVTLAGQAGLPGHVEVGDGATIAARAGVFGDVPAGAVYSGYPARPHKQALRAQAALFRLPELVKRIQALELKLLRRTSSDT
ncbi:MAG: UDP-3-O-(3-hydroxymyristoyl)glucosamine N-acyltransferase [Gemmatimonadetes bacterium]|nr:UDP-3-O-(3-hydroxymyristoyl)glucosamine N-acyltransferase [Gemmatimonadota bacterium]